MKKLLILFFALPLLTQGQIVSVQDSSGYLFSVNPLTGAKVQLTIPQTGQSGKALSTDGVRFSWITAGGMTNPMTTIGDIIVGGASGTPTRLAGASGYLFNNGSGTLSYQTPAAGIPTVTAPAATYLEADQQNNTSAADAIATATSMTSATTQWAHFSIHLFNGTGTSLKIQATKLVGGTITPLVGSYWTCTRVPSGNTGTFVN